MPNLIEITEFSAPELDVYARLSEVQLRSRQDPSQALFIAESPLVIGRALDAGCVPVSALMDGSHVSAAAREILARLGADVPVFTAEDAVLTQLTGFHLTRGMLCAMRRPALPEAGALCRAARRVVVLENVMNPTNLGAIFRSAAALNMDAVLLTEAGSDPLYRRAVRVSMGTVFQIPWTYLPDGWPEPSMGWLRAQGFRTVAMALRDDSVPLNDPRLLAEEPRHGGRRPCAGDDRRLRLHGPHPHVPWGGFFECGCGKRSRVLPAWAAIAPHRKGGFHDATVR